MPHRLRNHIAAAFLMLPAAATLVALPGVAQAQARAPEVRALQVTSDAGLRPGAQLRFTVEATPRARADVRIRGVESPVVLSEVRRGVYVGRYTIRRGDQIGPDSAMRATVRTGNRSATAQYPFPGEIVAQVPLPPPQVPMPLPPLRIERFTVAPLDRIEPGAELDFTVQGAPGGNASVDIPGMAQNVPLREVRPGFYQGTYTVRRADNLIPGRAVTVTLRLGERVVTAALAEPLVVADARPPMIRNISPREGEAVLDRGRTVVSGLFDDRDGAGVDPRSVRVFVSGRDVTADSEISARDFAFRADFAPGRYTVEVLARDRSGNAVRRNWSFNVVTQVGAAPMR